MKYKRGKVFYLIFTLMMIIVFFLGTNRLAYSEEFLYTVKKGDTLYSKAKHYNTVVNVIVERNKLKNPNKIYPGQKIYIPLGPGLGIYIVKKGDTLYRVAKKYNTAVNKIAFLSQVENPNKISIGQKLVVMISPSQPPVNIPPPASPPRVKTLEGIKTVIDPGHGGKQPGAVGPTGLKEKDVNLEISLILHQLLEDSGATVFMTRSFDTTVSLSERAEKSNEVNADIFVSIHNNSGSSEGKGSETLYYMGSQKGKKLASLIQAELVKKINTTDRGIKPRTELYVLKHTKAPAVIVEVAFISNPHEENLLKQPAFQKDAAIGIYNGIVRYFNE